MTADNSELMLACAVVCASSLPSSVTVNISYSVPYWFLLITAPQSLNTFCLFVCFFLSLCEGQWERQVSQTPGALQERGQPDLETSGRYQHCSGHTGVSVVITCFYLCGSYPIGTEGTTSVGGSFLWCVYLDN